MIKRGLLAIAHFAFSKCKDLVMPYHSQHRRLSSFSRDRHDTANSSKRKHSSSVSKHRSHHDIKQSKRGDEEHHEKKHGLKYDESSKSQTSASSYRKSASHHHRSSALSSSEHSHRHEHHHRHKDNEAVSRDRANDARSAHHSSSADHSLKSSIDSATRRVADSHGMYVAPYILPYLQRFEIPKPRCVNGCEPGCRSHLHIARYGGLLWGCEKQPAHNRWHTEPGNPKSDVFKPKDRGMPEHEAAKAKHKASLDLWKYSTPSGRVLD